MLSSDTKNYLKQLIQHYDLILENPDSPLNTYKPLIQEWKYECMHKLRKIKEADVEGMIMANASFGVSPFIDSAS